MKIKVPQFETKEELHDYLVKHLDEHIDAKKSEIKYADCMIPTSSILAEKVVTEKADATGEDLEVIKVRAIINTSNVMDNHDDVHFPKLWNKSLNENKYIKHLQEHQMAFDKIISDKEDLRAYAKTYDWKDMGIDAEGKTQALVFDSNVKLSRNPYMFSQYKEGNVDNHSVGMQYVNIKFALDSDKDDHSKYKEVWDKEIDNILNKEDVKKQGYFYAVYEAKVREGSAVPLGSNTITPTLSRRKDTQEEDKLAVEKALTPFINFLKT